MNYSHQSLANVLHLVSVNVAWECSENDVCHECYGMICELIVQHHCRGNYNKILLNEMDSDHGEILPHSQVKWLTPGRVLFRLREILLQMKTLLALFSFIFSKLFDFYCNKQICEVLTSSLPVIFSFTAIRIPTY